MSNIYKSASNLILSTPDQQIQLEAFFTAPEHFISFLDLDYIGSLNNFPNFRSLNLLSLVVAYISERDNNSLQRQLEPATNCQIICSSKEDAFSSIFVIIPKVNPYLKFENPDIQYLLLRFNLESLQSENENIFTNHIENIKNSLKTIQKKNAELCCSHSDLSKITFEKLEKKYQLELQNSSLLTDLSELRTRIIQLYKQFEVLENEEEKCGLRLRCILCENKLKNIVFLPCGHLLICEECLVQNLKTEPNSLIERRRKFLYCQTCKTKVKETRIILFN